MPYKNPQEQKEYHKEYCKTWRLTDKGKDKYQRGLTRSNWLKRRRRHWLGCLKVALGCALCGYNKAPEALDFDHLDPASKKFNVTRGGASIKRVIEEVRKCRVLCANCHRIETKKSY